MKCCLYRFFPDALLERHGLHCRSRQDLYSMMTPPYMSHHIHHVQFASVSRKGNQMVRCQGPMSLPESSGTLRFPQEGSLLRIPFHSLRVYDQGIELCKPRKASSFMMTRIPKVQKLMNKRNISMNQEAVAPVDIYKAI